MSADRSLAIAPDLEAREAAAAATTTAAVVSAEAQHSPSESQKVSAAATAAPERHHQRRELRDIVERSQVFKIPQRLKENLVMFEMC